MLRAVYDMFCLLNEKAFLDLKVLEMDIYSIHWNNSFHSMKTFGGTGAPKEFFLTVKCKFMPKGLDKYNPYNCCLELSLKSTRSILMTYCHWKNWFQEFLNYLKCHLYFWNWTRNEMQFLIHLFKMVFRLVCHLIYKTNLRNRFYCANLWY